jgi:hypothetical protein
VTLSNTTIYTVNQMLPIDGSVNLTIVDVVATAIDNLGVITTLGATSGAAPPFLIQYVPGPPVASVFA